VAVRVEVVAAGDEGLGVAELLDDAGGDRRPVAGLYRLRGEAPEVGEALIEGHDAPLSVDHDDPIEGRFGQTFQERLLELRRPVHGQSSLPCALWYGQRRRPGDGRRRMH
jgi:hypothetical protein